MEELTEEKATLLREECIEQLLYGLLSHKRTYEIALVVLGEIRTKNLLDKGNENG